MNTNGANEHKAAQLPGQWRPIMRTPQEARAAFEEAGISISCWAREHGFSPSTVAAVLRGDRRARIGQSHRIAVALRLKTGLVDVDPRDI